MLEFWNIGIMGSGIMQCWINGPTPGAIDDTIKIAIMLLIQAAQRSLRGVGSTSRRPPFHYSYFSLSPNNGIIFGIGLGSNIGHGLFVGWAVPTPGFVGFRCTQTNLHFAGAITKGETQQPSISEPSPKSFYFNQSG